MPLGTGERSETVLQEAYRMWASQPLRFNTDMLFRAEACNSLNSQRHG